MSENWEKINKRLAEFDGGFCVCDSYGMYTAHPGICGQCSRPRRPQYHRDIADVIRVAEKVFEGFTIEYFGGKYFVYGVRRGAKEADKEVYSTKMSEALALACYRAIKEGE